VGADDDARARAGQRPDDVAKPGLAWQRLEAPIRQHSPQLLGEPPQLRRPSRSLPDLHLPLDEPPSGVGIEAVDLQPTRAAARVIVAAAPGHGDRTHAENERAHHKPHPRKPPPDHGAKCDGRCRRRAVGDLGGHQLKPRLDREHADVRSPAAGDEHLVAVGRALDVVPEVVAEFVGADVDHVDRR
jgi:hypothetical protein